MEIIDQICSAILSIAALMFVHKAIYNVLGFFVKAKQYPKTDERRKYAFIIAARNEEKVIGNLIESIHRQTYDGPKPEIFVVADNCTDNTASLCRSLGAAVYERFDKEHVRKGYALEFLFDHIAEDYGIQSFDGYFVFDADNLLAPDFVERMNEVFCTGAKIVTSYRNTKNFDTNIVSAGYGIHFYHNSMAFHRPRSVLGVGTHLTGTGYLMASELIKDGWHYTNFTEDDQSTIAMAAQGHKVAYCEAAEFFDEQPVDFVTAFRQRIRWARGRLTAFFRYGGQVFAGIFKHKTFTCYDMFTHYFPYGLFVWVIGIIYPLCTFVANLISPESTGYGGMIANILLALGTSWGYSILGNAITVIRERRHIHCSNAKLILYVIASPWFSLVSIPIYLVAIVAKVTWSPIIHNDARKIDDLVKK